MNTSRDKYDLHWEDTGSLTHGRGPKPQPPDGVRLSFRLYFLRYSTGVPQLQSQSRNSPSAILSPQWRVTFARRFVRFILHLSLDWSGVPFYPLLCPATNALSLFSP